MLWDWEIQKAHSAPSTLSANVLRNGPFRPSTPCVMRLCPWQSASVCDFNVTTDRLSDCLGRAQRPTSIEASTFGCSEVNTFPRALALIGRVQAVIATSSASFSDGFIYPRVLRGRSLSSAAIRVRSFAL